jgi:hypothetical protein
MEDEQVMVFGGLFFDNPEIQFAELLNPNVQPIHQDLEDYSLPNSLEKLHHCVGGSDFLGMFSLVQN